MTGRISRGRSRSMLSLAAQVNSLSTANSRGSRSSLGIRWEVEDRMLCRPVVKLTSRLVHLLRLRIKFGSNNSRHSSNNSSRASNRIVISKSKMLVLVVEERLTSLWLRLELPHLPKIQEAPSDKLTHPNNNKTSGEIDNNTNNNPTSNRGKAMDSYRRQERPRRHYPPKMRRAVEWPPQIRIRVNLALIWFNPSASLLLHSNLSSCFSSRRTQIRERPQVRTRLRKMALTRRPTANRPRITPMC